MAAEGSASGTKCVFELRTTAGAGTLVGSADGTVAAIFWSLLFPASDAGKPGSGASRVSRLFVPTPEGKAASALGLLAALAPGVILKACVPEP
jgi:hypothetical protein